MAKLRTKLAFEPEPMRYRMALTKQVAIGIRWHKSARQNNGIKNVKHKSGEGKTVNSTEDKIEIQVCGEMKYEGKQ